MAQQVQRDFDRNSLRNPAAEKDRRSPCEQCVSKKMFGCENLGHGRACGPCRAEYNDEYTNQCSFVTERQRAQSKVRRPKTRGGITKRSKSGGAGRGPSHPRPMQHASTSQPGTNPEFYPNPAPYHGQPLAQQQQQHYNFQPPPPGLQQYSHNSSPPRYTHHFDPQQPQPPVTQDLPPRPSGPYRHSLEPPPESQQLPVHQHQPTVQYDYNSQHQAQPQHQGQWYAEAEQYQPQQSGYYQHYPYDYHQ
ncbi:hypothetical protein C8R46DRAFT_1025266 [Mycena filopes]|nr:hypothetical protein C8R46DRAFT_1025266 [Mycena filopes]